MCSGEPGVTAYVGVEVGILMLGKVCRLMRRMCLWILVEGCCGVWPVMAHGGRHLSILSCSVGKAR